jgi:hypothetical protein
MNIWQTLENNASYLVKYIFPDTPRIIAYQNNAENKTPYCAIIVQEIDAVAREEVSSLTNTYVEDGVTKEGVLVKEQYEGYVKFSFVGKDDCECGASDLCTRFSQMLQSPATNEYMRSIGLAYRRKGTIKRVPTFRDTQWYQSYEIEVWFGFMTAVYEESPSLASVDIYLNDLGVSTITVNDLEV